LYSDIADSFASGATVTTVLRNAISAAALVWAAAARAGAGVSVSVHRVLALRQVASSSVSF
jgi:hypothetical protein